MIRLRCPRHLRQHLQQMPSFIPCTNNTHGLIVLGCLVEVCHFSYCTHLLPVRCLKCRGSLLVLSRRHGPWMEKEKQLSELFGNHFQEKCMHKRNT